MESVIKHPQFSQNNNICFLASLIWHGSDSIYRIKYRINLMQVKYSMHFKSEANFIVDKNVYLS